MEAEQLVLADLVVHQHRHLVLRIVQQGEWRYAAEVDTEVFPQFFHRSKRQSRLADLLGQARQTGLLALAQQYQVVAIALAIAQEEILDPLVGQLDPMFVERLDRRQRRMLDPHAVDTKLIQQRQQCCLVDR
ncbi:hypothetical protein D3C78_732350 [compost metagenome]